jgi:hypothetical protein
VIVVDEYIAARVVGGDWPAGLPDDELVLTAARHWRLFQALHGGRGGQLSQLLARLSPAGRDGMRYPHPEVLQVLDPRPVLDEAAILAARFGGAACWLPKPSPPGSPTAASSGSEFPAMWATSSAGRPTSSALLSTSPLRERGRLPRPDLDDHDDRGGRHQ